MSERVLVFEAELLNELGRFQGFSLDVEWYLPRLLDPHHAFYVDRALAECDTALKQLIPYVLLRFESSFFTYVRGRVSAETRLHARLSIGLGGHISEGRERGGSRGETLYRSAAAREVNEEVHIDSTYCEHIVGLINDDSDDVGRVHFGIVHIWDLRADRSVRPREEQIEALGFLTINDLRAQEERLENWSRIAIEMVADARVPLYNYRA